jgi:hypothetical protein
MNELATIASWLKATGPWGLVAALGYSLWKLSDKKDASLRELYQEVVQLSRAQTEAVIKVEAALIALKDAIAAIQPKARRASKKRTET